MASKLMYSCLVVLFVFYIKPSQSSNRPIDTKYPLQPLIVWHGTSECDETPNPIRMTKMWSERGAIAKKIRIGETCDDDYNASIYMGVEKQVMNVCRQVVNDPDLKNGFTLMGLSQGGILARALVQMCPEANITDLIDLGAPNQGTFGMPDPASLTSEYFIKFSSLAIQIQDLAGQISPVLDTPSIFTSFFNKYRDNFAFGSYWVDPSEQPPTNNLVNRINNALVYDDSMKQNLLRLKRYINIWFEYDTTLVPKESAMFGKFESSATENIIQYNETELFLEDRIGLRTMDQTGQHIIIKSPYDHMKYPDEWFVEAILNRFYYY